MTEEERIREEDVDRILATVANIYSSGYSEGMGLVANEYELRGLIPAAASRMPKDLEARLGLIREALKNYRTAIEAKIQEIKAKQISPDQEMHEVLQYAQRLMERHSNQIAQVEYAKGRMDGATAIMDESGQEYEFRFPHFDIATPGHEVCPICEAIAENSPYSPEEAEAMGYPDVPHPNCDHGWVLVPKGEKTRTEEFPKGPAVV